jgi:hypothetical protein
MTRGARTSPVKVIEVDCGWYVKQASMNCSDNRDISSYLYVYVQDRKITSAISYRRADAINHGGANIAPSGTDRSKSVHSINTGQAPYKWGNML